MGEVVFATSLYVGICRMGTTLLQHCLGMTQHKRVSKGSYRDVLHQSMFVGSSCLHWEDV